MMQKLLAIQFSPKYKDQDLKTLASSWVQYNYCIHLYSFFANGGNVLPAFNLKRALWLPWNPTMNTVTRLDLEYYNFKCTPTINFKADVSVL